MKDSIQIAKPELCISCGHCAAICPQAAIACNDKNTRKPFNISAIDDNLAMDQKLFQTKRSIRQFIDNAIENDKLKEIIEYAEMAPSSHNL